MNLVCGLPLVKELIRDGFQYMTVSTIGPEKTSGILAFSVCDIVSEVYGKGKKSA